MKLHTCFCPVIITNPYTKERLSVPCGKCKACRTNKASLWVEKLERERASHPFSIFFTLTYSEKYIRSAYLRGNEYFDENHDLLFNIKDDDCINKLNDFSPEDWQYLNKRRLIYYPNYNLIQLFIKRLRSKLFDNEKDIRKRYLRYYITTEYGPTTFRPHHHGILFCDSEWFVENGCRLLNEAWSSDGRRSSSERYGIVDVQPQPVSCSSYVAGYLNSMVSLPKVYTFPTFRPKVLLSKRPPLGSYFVNSEEVKDIFFNGTPYHTVYRRKSNSYVDIPVEPYVKNRLFPKIRCFDQLLHNERVELYRFVCETESTTFEDFQKACEEVLSYDRYSTPTQFNYVWLLSQTDSSLYRYYLACRRCYAVMLLFDVDLEQYLSLMDNFYYNVEQYKLKQQFEMQSQIVSFYKADCFLSADPLYLDNLSRFAPFYTLTQRLTLKNYGIDPDSFSPGDLAFGTSSNFSDFKSDVEVRYKKSLKTKLRNDYQMSNKSKCLFDLIQKIYAR